MSEEIKRRHHFLSRFYLSGFLAPGETHLHARDLREKKAWRGTPDELAHQRDLFRPTAAFPHPNSFEDAFGEVEGEIAPALGRAIQAERIISPDDLAHILHIVALNAARPPAEIAEFETRFDELARERMAAFVTPEMHRDALERMRADGMPTDLVEDFEAWKTRLTDGSVRLHLTRDALLTFGVAGRASEILDLLLLRTWTLLVASDEAAFLCSDRPVALLCGGGLPPELAAFNDKRCDVVMPLSRRLALVGSDQGRAGAVTCSVSAVGCVNHLTRASADRFLYSGSTLSIAAASPSRDEWRDLERTVYPGN